ncbi:6038_t:CDS:10 [Entrophospora sp. SA101]|nr:6038_t:CDS:10 [Entrophospora sp. SA101]CAJ0838261.1 12972_t:CDS:10 [Entrophospora sp. SA101]
MSTFNSKRINFIILIIVYLICILLPSFPVLVYTIEEETPKEQKFRHDYKFTFKKPYYYNNTVPFFDTYGPDALLAPDFIRLAPSVPKHSGSIWSQYANTYKDWMIELSFRISGNYFLGGRGMAFWYTKDRGQEGPVFGSKDQWNGLGIMFETADVKKKREKSIVMGHINDGIVLYNNLTNPAAKSIGGCYRLFRNTQTPIFVKIYYFDNNLKVYVDIKDDGKKEPQLCFEAKNIQLPLGNYFGVSALADGDTPDDHDVLSMETFEINPPEKAPRIEEVKKMVVNPTEGSKEEDIRSLAFIRGMQTKILESLDRLHELIKRIESNLDYIESRISKITIVSYEQSIKEIKDDLKRISSKIEAMDSRIAGQFYQTQKSFQEANKSKSNEKSSVWSYITYFTLFIIIVVGGYALWRTKAELDQKKFI